MFQKAVTNKAKCVDHGVKVVTDLCTFLNVEFPDIKTNFKLGNKTSNSWRPLKLIFNNKKQRKDILDNANKLNNIPETNHLARCVIAKDLKGHPRTPQQY